ncbi:NtaA/DmoA family FMN-dependent monooxygenase [Nocardioides sp. CER19]|uniref:NtaA/DmoA family FMN-dependent monooxygenase n=1 Tax=Nocardioides sp. CER19 TaxID=3038538 RepID=UPI002447F9BF|nr:NtaA/DmoA family FMN-dependent monooxygenase [Nocardioides sp. CER19]MDH2416293.1 NtaA/DmoA family FMN-dependent monooxygenase [Nocardioides sp. CER19]
MTARPQAHLTAFLAGFGYHESAWKVSPRELARPEVAVETLVKAAQTAERGLFDAAFFADTPGIQPFRARYFPQVGFDPLELIAAIAAVTSRIGLIGTASTTYSAPYDLARRLATVDFLSGGRAGWNIVTTRYVGAAGNFGLAGHPPHDERYARAAEFVDVVSRLWASWEEDAVVADPDTGVWARQEGIRPVEFRGRYFEVAGALTLPRSPQGRPAFAQAGSSGPGIELAGSVADLVFTAQSTVDASRAFRDQVRAAAVRHGRSAADVLVLPGVAFVIGSTEEEARAKRQALENAVDPEFRWRNLAHNASLDHERVDPDRPLDEAAAAAASIGGERTSRTDELIRRTAESGKPFRELAAELTGLPGGLEFTGTPEQLADLIEDWVLSGASDGFTLQPTTLPESLELFVDHVVPLLQDRGLHRTEYAETTLRGHLGVSRPAVPTPKETLR